jgi:hypothetical protein
VKQHHLVVTGAQLAAAEPTLSQKGQAPVQVTDEISGDRQTDVISIDQRVGAADDPHTPRAILAEGGQLMDFPFSVRRYETRTVAPLIYGGIAALVLGTFTVAMACSIGCDDPDYRTPAQYTVIGISAVGVGALVVGLVLCVKDGDCLD